MCTCVNILNMGLHRNVYIVYMDVSTHVCINKSICVWIMSMCKQVDTGMCACKRTHRLAYMCIHRYASVQMWQSFSSCVSAGRVCK